MNLVPSLAVFVNDIVGTRVLERPEHVAYMEPQGENFTVAFRELNNRGTRFSTTILIRGVQQVCTLDPCYDYTLCGEEVFGPFTLLARSTIPYVCVRNECGDRWFMSIETPKDNWIRGRWSGDGLTDRDPFGNYTMPIVCTQVTDRPYAPNATLGTGSGSGSGSGSGA